MPIRDLLTSKKFLVSLLTAALAIGSKFVPQLADLDAVELAGLLSPLLIYVLSQGIADHGKEAVKMSGVNQMLADERKAE